MRMALDLHANGLGPSAGRDVDEGWISLAQTAHVYRLTCAVAMVLLQGVFNKSLLQPRTDMLWGQEQDVEFGPLADVAKHGAFGVACCAAQPAPARVDGRAHVESLLPADDVIELPVERALILQVIEDHKQAAALKGPTDGRQRRQSGRILRPGWAGRGRAGGGRAARHGAAIVGAHWAIRAVPPRQLRVVGTCRTAGL